MAVALVTHCLRGRSTPPAAPILNQPLELLHKPSDSPGIIPDIRPVLQPDFSPSANAEEPPARTKAVTRKPRTAPILPLRNTRRSADNMTDRDDQPRPAQPETEADSGTANSQSGNGLTPQTKSKESATGTAATDSPTPSTAAASSPVSANEWAAEAGTDNMTNAFQPNTLGQTIKIRQHLILELQQAIIPTAGPTDAALRHLANGLPQASEAWTAAQTKSVHRRLSQTLDQIPTPPAGDAVRISRVFELMGRMTELTDGPRQAIPMYTRSLGLNPDSETAYQGRARSYLKIDAPDKALADLEKALQLNPKSSETQANLVAVWLQKEDSQKAAQALSNALRLSAAEAGRTSAKSIIHYIRTLSESRSLDTHIAEALAETRAARGDMPLPAAHPPKRTRTVPLWRWGFGGLALGATVLWIKKHGYFTALVLRRRNTKKKRQMSKIPSGLEAQILALTREIEAQPHDYLRYKQRAALYEQAKQPEQALADYLESVRLKPDYLLSIKRLAQLYYEIHDYQNARHWVTLSLQIQPEDILSLRLQGCMLDAAHDFEGSLACFRKVNALIPKFRNLDIRPVDLVQYQNQITLYNGLTETEKNSETGRYTRAYMKVCISDWPQAEKLLNDLIAAHPASKNSRYLRSIVRKQLGDLAGSQEDLKASNP